MSSVSRPIYSLDDIPDVSVAAPAAGEVLKWNGTAWVAANYATSYAFAVASFDDGESSTQLAGTAGAEWKAAGALTFSATYTNGPATAAHIVRSGWSDLTLLTPFTSVVSAQAVNYPSPGSSVTFTLHAAKGAETDENDSTTVAFYNNLYHGVTAQADSYDSAFIRALTTIAINNTKNRTLTVSPSSQYVVYAYPARLGTSTFTVNGFPGGFESPLTVAVDNAAGLTENFYVYRSTQLLTGTSIPVVVT